MLSILLSLLGFVLLTLGTAVFVAAEFSLTALERSTVDANARHGGRRDKMVQRAHRTLSFQLSGAQIGISITTLITGYLAEPVIARLLRGPLTAVGLPERWLEGTALIVALFIATSVSMVFGELVAQYLAVAVPLRTARVVAGPQVLLMVEADGYSCTIATSSGPRTFQATAAEDAYGQALLAFLNGSLG